MENADNKEETLNKLAYILKMQLEKQDYKGSVQTIKLQSELLGLFPDKNLKLESNYHLQFPEIDKDLLIERLKLMIKESESE